MPFSPSSAIPALGFGLAAGGGLWALFEQWLAEGASPKHRWAMMALGYLGSDAVALKLAPLIRAWPSGLRELAATRSTTW
jgi:hypothetical protein